MAIHITLHTWNSLGINFKCSSQVCFLQITFFFLKMNKASKIFTAVAYEILFSFFNCL